jgi:hypothetical protein
MADPIASRAAQQNQVRAIRSISGPEPRTTGQRDAANVMWISEGAASIATGLGVALAAAASAPEAAVAEEPEAGAAS